MLIESNVFVNMLLQYPVYKGKREKVVRKCLESSQRRTGGNYPILPVHDEFFNSLLKAIKRKLVHGE